MRNRPHAKNPCAPPAHATAVCAVLVGARGSLTAVELDADKAARAQGLLQAFQSYLSARCGGAKGRRGGGQAAVAADDVCASVQVGAPAGGF
jgi:hypothetical protein